MPNRAKKSSAMRLSQRLFRGFSALSPRCTHYPMDFEHPDRNLEVVPDEWRARRPGHTAIRMIGSTDQLATWADDLVEDLQNRSLCFLDQQAWRQNKRAIVETLREFYESDGYANTPAMLCSSQSNLSSMAKLRIPGFAYDDFEWPTRIYQPYQTIILTSTGHADCRVPIRTSAFVWDSGFVGTDDTRFALQRRVGTTTRYGVPVFQLYQEVLGVTDLSEDAAKWLKLRAFPAYADRCVVAKDKARVLMSDFVIVGARRFRPRPVHPTSERFFCSVELIVFILCPITAKLIAISTYGGDLDGYYHSCEIGKLPFGDWLLQLEDRFRL
jgi:hypothetical protein